MKISKKLILLVVQVGCVYVGGVFGDIPVNLGEIHVSAAQEALNKVVELKKEAITYQEQLMGEVSKDRKAGISVEEKEDELTKMKDVIQGIDAQIAEYTKAAQGTN